MKHLLVATDLSPIADAALERAIAFAARDGAKITIAYAEPDYAATPAMSEVESAAFLELANLESEVKVAVDEQMTERAERAKEAGVPVEVIARKGNPDDVVPEIAGEVGADLVVLATHGRTGIKRFLLGSVAEHVVRRSPVSVLVTRGTDVENAEFRRILIGTDFSPAADKALRQAIALSAPGAEIEIAHVWQYPPGTWGLGALADHTKAMDALRSALTAGATERGQKMLELYKGCGRHLTFELLHGPAASVLTTRAETTDRDLIAVATHGYRGFRRLLLGSVAEATVRHAPCSVLAAHAEHLDR
jgi:nucleotide-binding universal stress UspA family protein